MIPVQILISPQGDGGTEPGSPTSQVSALSTGLKVIREAAPIEALLASVRREEGIEFIPTRSGVGA